VSGNQRPGLAVSGKFGLSAWIALLLGWIYKRPPTMPCRPTPAPQVSNSSSPVLQCLPLQSPPSLTLRRSPRSGPPLLLSLTSRVYLPLTLPQSQSTHSTRSPHCERTRVATTSTPQTFLLLMSTTCLLTRRRPQSQSHSPNTSSCSDSVRVSHSLPGTKRKLTPSFVVFPPFWIMGAWILWSPLQAPTCDGDAELAWMPEKTEAERKKIIEEIRTVEIKWALRCLWSILVLVLLGSIGGIAGWAILHSH